MQYKQSSTPIADIGHNRHIRQWCTFFKPVPFFAQRTQNLNLFWPILLQVYAPFGVLLQGGGVPKLTNVCYALGSSELDKRVSMIELRMRNLFM